MGQVILSCGCTQGDPARGMCDTAFNLYDVLRHALENYETERDIAAMHYRDTMTAEEKQANFARTHELHALYKTARRDFRLHYKIPIPWALQDEHLR